MQLLKFITLLGLTGTVLAAPHPNPEPQRAAACTTYVTLTNTVTIAPTVTIPAMIVAVERTVSCGSCELVTRTVLTTTTVQKLVAGVKQRTAVRKTTSTITLPVCKPTD
ncbi:hypothetical protein TWF718_006339 [Orbilia javanica]|uniref:Uncharacterized protein n=1 Tax=Orbilia javanica TaxID=47235 RepID=A0AAN8REW6_9PEZI